MASLPSPVSLVAAERGPASLPAGTREPTTFSPARSSSGLSSGRCAWPVRTHLTPRGKIPATVLYGSGSSDALQRGREIRWSSHVVELCREHWLGAATSVPVTASRTSEICTDRLEHVGGLCSGHCECLIVLNPMKAAKQAKALRHHCHGSSRI
jgi:hypothetical protein